MKKFLSLVLALVMTMSLVTISAGAKDFTDADKVTYTEAVDVLSAVKVIDGYTDGAFKPTTQLNRGQAAKILCNMILGPTTASALKADAAPFKDVAADNTFAAYIAYCAKEGIIDGYTDGTFRPTAPLTGYAFMKLLLGALGYDADVEGYNTPGSWSISVAKRALNIGLDKGLVSDFDGTKAVTREEACLYALNTLKADMVEYDTKTNISIGGAEVIIAGSAAKVMKNTSNSDGKVFDKDGEMQFAEKYFTNLSVTKGSDDFARPANVWKLKAEKIGTYADKADLTYTKSVKSKDIYADLGLGSTVASYDVDIYNNGEPETYSIAIKKGSEDKITAAGNGVLTEVFYDSDDDTIIVTSVQTYVGTINKSVAAKGDKDAYVEIAAESKPTSVGGGILTFDTVEEFEDDAYVLYTYSESADEVKSVALAEKVSGAVTKAENSNTNNADSAALTIDGERYKASKNIAGQKLSDVTVKEDYIVYLDAYGYMIYVEENESTDYALVRDAAAAGTFVGKKAELVFADGTTKIVTTAKNYRNEAGFKVGVNFKPTIVTYKVDNDGVYTLKPVSTTVRLENEQNFEMTNDKAGIKVGANTVTANSASTFVIGEEGKDIANIEDFTAYTGIKNAPSIKTETTATDANKQADVYYYCKSGSMVTIMFVLPEKNLDVTDGVDKTVFLAKESASNLIHDAEGDYFEYNAVVNGEITTVKVADDVTINGTPFALTYDLAGKVTACGHTKVCASYSAHVKNTLNGLYKGYKIDKHGVITDLTTYALDTYTVGSGAKQGYLTNDGINKANKEYTAQIGYNAPVAPSTTPTYDDVITVDEKATFFYVDKDGKITESTYKALAQDNDDHIYAYVKDWMVKTLFVEEVPTAVATYGVKIDREASTNYAWYEIDFDTVTSAITLEADEKGDDVYFHVAAADGYQIDDVDGAVPVYGYDGWYVVYNVKSIVNVTVKASAIPDASMYINIVYKDGAGNVVDETGPQLKPNAAGTSFLTVANGIAADAGYKLAVGERTSKTVAFVEDGYAEVEFKVYKVAALTMPEGMTATWAAGADYPAGTAAAGETTKVPVGASVVPALATGVGTWTSTGSQFNAGTETFTMPATTKTVTNAWGYFKVTISMTGDLAGATTKVGEGDNYIAANGFVTIKVGNSGWNWNVDTNNINVVSGDATLSEKTPVDGNENVTYKLTFTGNTDGTVVLKDSWT